MSLKNYALVAWVAMASGPHDARGESLEQFARQMMENRSKEVLPPELRNVFPGRYRQWLISGNLHALAVARHPQATADRLLRMFVSAKGETDHQRPGPGFSTVALGQDEFLYLAICESTLTRFHGPLTEHGYTTRSLQRRGEVVQEIQEYVATCQGESTLRAWANLMRDERIGPRGVRRLLRQMATISPRGDLFRTYAGNLPDEIDPKPPGLGSDRDRAAARELTTHAVRRLESYLRDAPSPAPAANDSPLKRHAFNLRIDAMTLAIWDPRAARPLLLELLGDADTRRSGRLPLADRTLLHGATAGEDSALARLLTELEKEPPVQLSNLDHNWLRRVFRGMAEQQRLIDWSNAHLANPNPVIANWARLARSEREQTQ